MLRSMVGLGLLLLSLASGCAFNRQYFRPTERVRGQTLQGYPESFYDLMGAKGRFGEAKVWTVGSYRKGDDTVIEVALDLHNTSGKPVEVASTDLFLDPVTGSNGQLRKVPAAETGTFSIGAESRATLRVHFVLPEGWKPGHVRSFGFVWKVKGEEQSYAQATPFLEQEPYYGPSPAYYYGYGAPYPCNPYDLHCFYGPGPYGGYPYYGGYGYGVGGSVVIEHAPPVERRRVNVH